MQGLSSYLPLLLVALLAAGTWWLVQDRTDYRRTQDELHSNLARIKETNQKLEEAQNQLLQQDKMASIGQLAAGVAARIPTRTNDDDRYFSDTWQLMPLEGYTAMFRRLLEHPNIVLDLNTDFDPAAPPTPRRATHRCAARRPPAAPRLCTSATELARPVLRQALRGACQRRSPRLGARRTRTGGARPGCIAQHPAQAQGGLAARRQRLSLSPPAGRTRRAGPCGWSVARRTDACRP